MTRKSFIFALIGCAVVMTAAAAEDKSPSPPTATTPAAEDYKIVDAGDLYVGTRKYLGKAILLKRMHCYYADVDDYRCIAAGDVSLAVFTQKVEPSSAKDWVEKNCDQLKVAVTSDKCVFNPQFAYNAEDVRDDIVSGYQRRMVIRLGSVTMVPTKKLK